MILFDKFDLYQYLYLYYWKSVDSHLRLRTFVDNILFHQNKGEDGKSGISPGRE